MLSLSWALLLLGSLSHAAAAAAAAHVGNGKEVLHLMHQQMQLKEAQRGASVGQRHQDRLPTQPIHRSMLSRRKRRILPETTISGEQREKGEGHVALRAKYRESRYETESFDAAINEDELPSQPNGDEQSSASEPTPSLLASASWVKIHEEAGRNSFNFIPASRRAASSVIFTYTHDVNDSEDGVVSGTKESSDFAQGLEMDVNQNNSTSKDVDVATKNTLSSNVTEGAQVVGESNQKSFTQDKDLRQHENEAMREHTSEEEEYMIISGGYTDRDWTSFPVYAFPISSSIRTLSAQWIDLSPSLLEDNVETRCIDEDGKAAREKLYQEAMFLDTKDPRSFEDPWEHAQNCPPSGRMGHQSVVHNGKLYVFGGLIYDEEWAGGNGYGRKETFRLEDVPFMYRLDLAEMFEARKSESKGNGGSMQKKVKGWQRIIPRVTPFSTLNGMSSTSAAEVLLTFVNRGEIQGGMWSSGSTGGHDKFVMYGGLRIARVEYEGFGHKSPSKFVRGEARFGSASQMRPQKIVEHPLGDVWTYDLVLDSWEKMTNNYGRAVKGGKDAEVNDANDDETIVQHKDPPSNDDDWWYDLDTSDYPRPRTAHAATVVGDELVVHGGMGWDEHTNDWDGSTDWETLDDMWILNLKTRKWTRRWLFPLLVRSYHSLVGWSVDENMMGWGKDFENFTSWEGPVVAAFGGYTTGIDVFSGKELAYVFDDLLVSYPPFPKTNHEEVYSPWLKASMSVESDEWISTRYEHSAVLSKEGALVVWGGSFQDTSHMKGMWMINIAGEDSSVNLFMAEADSIYNDYERTITAIHTIVIMLMFLSISLTLLLGLTQRYQELVQQANDDAAVAAGVVFSAQDDDSLPTRRGNGLHPQIIHTLPLKTYSSNVKQGNGGTRESHEECCPICLVSYEEGDELRVLPCNHFMHKTCLDAWLENHPSCPTCRHSLSELVDDRPMMQLRTLRSRLTNNLALAGFLDPDDGLSDIEMTSNFGNSSLQRDGMIDLRYISTPTLSERDAAMGTRGDGPHQGSSAEDAPTVTAMDDLRSWRRQRRQLQRERRRSSLASFRQNVSRIRRNQRRRIPLTDVVEE